MLTFLFDKKVNTLRALAFAATIMIVATPQNVFKPGFQMSFFAVLGICFAFSEKSPTVIHGCKYRFLKKHSLAKLGTVNKGDILLIFL